MCRMSAIGTKQTSLVAPHMSAFGGKADMALTRLKGPLMTAAHHCCAITILRYGAEAGGKRPK